MSDTPPTPPPPAKPKTLSQRVLALGPQIVRIQEVRQIGGWFNFELSKLDGPMRAVGVEPKEGAITVHPEGPIVSVAIKYGVQVFASEPVETPKDPAPEPLVEIYAEFEIRYQFGESQDADAEVWMEFAKINGRFNTTAYWREFVGSCCMRAGVPPINVPPFNAAHAIKTLQAGEKSKAAPAV